MAKFLITGADGQLGQCFQLVAQEFSSNDFIFANQNELDIPYGNYTTPRIYQNYISTLNLDTKELYLFSENKKIERFPIFSSNFYDFSTRENQTVLVVVGDQDELLYYTVD